MTTQTTSKQTFEISTHIEAPIAQVYHCFSTRSGWLDWFAEKGFGYVAPDGILELHHHEMGKFALWFQELEKAKRVSFRFMKLTEPDVRDVEILFEEADQGVAITLVHTDLPEETQTFWQDRLDTLKAIFETGRNPHLWGRPFLGVAVDEWVTPEYAAEHNLTAQSGMLLSSVFEGRGAEKAGIQDGDVILSLAGQPVNSFGDLQAVFANYRAGDTLDVTFYHGAELKETRLTLSQYPVPEVSANTQDIAEKLERFYQKVNASIRQLVEDKLEAQMEYRPAAGEWNAKEIIAHLIAYEADVINWLSTYIVGQEVYAYTARTPATIKTLTTVYPTMDALLNRFRQTQQELVTLLGEVPVDMVSRKTSMVRLSLSFSISLSLHYKSHLNQLKETLEAAADVRGS